MTVRRAVARAALRALVLSVLGMLVIAGAAVAKLAVIPGTYAGSTSERVAVSLRISSDHKTITGFSTTLGYNGTCDRQGGGPGYNVRASRIKIGSGGSFSKSVTLSFRSFRAPGTISGHVAFRKVIGKVVQFVNGTANRCYTETFTATRV